MRGMEAERKDAREGEREEECLGWRVRGRRMHDRVGGGRGGAVGESRRANNRTLIRISRLPLRSEPTCPLIRQNTGNSSL